MTSIRFEKTRVYSYSWMSADVQLCTPSSYEEVLDCLTFAKRNGLRVCPLGSGLSFGDAALLNKRIMLDVTKLNQILSFDPNNGNIRVQSGTRTIDVLKFLVPHGRGLTGLSGSKGNTIAGNVSNDVNGKDAWKNGTFCTNVISMMVMTSNGDVIEVDRKTDANLFDAICGGLGLIAVILEVTLRTVPSVSYRVSVRSEKTGDISSTISALDENAEKQDFTYCWVDTSANGASSGRGICESARFVIDDHMHDAHGIQQGFEMKKPLGLFNPELFWTAMRIFYTNGLHQQVSRLKYTLSKDIDSGVVDYTKFQYPMVSLFSHWNLQFYPHGFREAQLLFPSKHFETAFTEIMGFCTRNGIPPWICGVKKHREENGLLSFGGDGYSFTLNYSLKGMSEEKIKRIEASIIGLTIKHHGKCYLGKFPFMGSSELEAMYPQLPAFVSVKWELDPNGLLWSDAAERMMPNA